VSEPLRKPTAEDFKKSGRKVEVVPYETGKTGSGMLPSGKDLDELPIIAEQQAVAVAKTAKPTTLTINRQDAELIVGIFADATVPFRFAREVGNLVVRLGAFLEMSK